MQSHESLNARIEACLRRLGRHSEAAASILADLNDGSFSPSRATALIQMYREAGQLADLTRMLDEIDEAARARWEADDYLKDVKPEEMRAWLPSNTVRELLQIDELGERGDASALISIAEDVRSYESDLSEPSSSNWRPKAAADALARMGQKGFAAIKHHYAEAEGTSAWLIYAVGHCEAAETFSWLREHTEKQQNYQAAMHFTYALSCKGEAGKRVLQRFAPRDDNLGMAAKRWLERDANVTQAAETAKAKPGTLPRDVARH